MAFSSSLEWRRISGHRIAFHREGRGEAVVLIHGITTNSFIWRRVAPLLRDRFEVIAYDLLGCGESDKPLHVPFSLNHHATMLADLLEELEIPRCHLVGHDVGGGIAQIFAVRHPGTLIDLSLVNSVAYDFWPVQPIIAMRTPIVRQLAMATLDLGALRLIVRHGLYHKDRLTDELMELFWKPMHTREGRKGFLHFARSLDNRNLLDIEEQLRHLAARTLIVRGDADPYLSAAISERLAAEIPNSRLVRIPTASHFIQEDEPERVARELADFFGA